MEKAQVKIESPEYVFQCSHFNYLTNAEKNEVFNLVKNKFSIIASFSENDVVKFSAVIDCHDNCLHIRDVGGHFLKTYFYLDVFVTALAKHLGKQKISTNTARKAIIKHLQKVGFVDNGAEYERIILA